MPDSEFDAAGMPVELESLSNVPGPNVILMRSKNLSVAWAGDVAVDSWAPGAPTVATWSDSKRGQYLRLVTKDDEMLGFVAVGMPRSAAELSMHAIRGTLPAGDRTVLLAAEHATKEHEMGPDDVLCSCSRATVGMVQDAAQEGCQNVTEIGECTRAGTDAEHATSRSEYYSTLWPGNGSYSGAAPSAGTD